jgi:hypothetical protein
MTEGIKTVGSWVHSEFNAQVRARIASGELENGSVIVPSDLIEGIDETDSAALAHRLVDKGNVLGSTRYVGTSARGLYSFTLDENGALRLEYPAEPHPFDPTTMPNFRK